MKLRSSHRPVPARINSLRSAEVSGATGKGKKERVNTVARGKLLQHLSGPSGKGSGRVGKSVASKHTTQLKSKTIQEHGAPSTKDTKTLKEAGVLQATSSGASDPGFHLGVSKKKKKNNACTSRQERAPAAIHTQIFPSMPRDNVPGSSQSFIEVRVLLREKQKIKTPVSGAMDGAAEAGSLELYFDQTVEHEVRGQDEETGWLDKTNDAAVETWIDGLQYSVKHDQALEKAVSEVEKAVFGNMPEPSAHGAFSELNGWVGTFRRNGARDEYYNPGAVQKVYHGFGDDGAGDDPDDDLEAPSLTVAAQMQSTTLRNGTFTGTKTTTKKRLAKKILKKMVEARKKH